MKVLNFGTAFGRWTASNAQKNLSLSLEQHVY